MNKDIIMNNRHLYILVVLALLISTVSLGASVLGPFFKLGEMAETNFPDPTTTGLQSTLIAGTEFDALYFNDGTEWLAVSGGGYPYRCSKNVQATYLMDAGVITLTRSADSLYMVVCNSRESSSGNVRCRADDAGVPSTTTGSVGDVLGVGDCITYSQRSSPIDCIGGGNYVTAFECIK